MAKNDKPVEEEAIPAFRDDDKILMSLGQKDFPKTQKGKIAWCDYGIQKLMDKKNDILEKTSPKAKAQKKAAKLRKQLEMLQELIDAEDDE